MWIERLAQAGITFVPAAGGTFKLFTPPDIDADTLAVVRSSKANIVAELNESLEFWIDTALSAGSNDDLNDVLDCFRPLRWTDEQRANMARACDRRRHVLCTK